MVKKTYEELETEAQGVSSQISDLETRWDTEGEPEKLAKMESKIERLEARRDRIYNRMDSITNAESEDNNDKEKEEEEDVYICEDCGGDLEKRKDGLFECVNCGEVYEEGE